MTVFQTCGFVGPSIRQYRRPNGEAIALLVLAPSKTDRERVISYVGRIFHVIACIVRRLAAGRPPFRWQRDSIPTTACGVIQNHFSSNVISDGTEK
jgi:hypothetical protein